MIRSSNAAICGVLVAIPLTPASAQTLSVPAQYSSIESALQAAVPGDTIEIASGVYFENLQLIPDVRLVGVGPTLPVLRPADPMLPILVGDDPSIGWSTRIERLRFSGGFADDGAAIRLTSGASPWVTGCQFRDLHAQVSGGAIFVGDDAAPYVIDCEFSDCHAARAGGAIFVEDTAAGATRIDDSLFTSNTGGSEGGGAIGSDGPVVIRACTFVGNSARDGGATKHHRADYVVRDCSFEGNTADNGGAVQIVDLVDPAAFVFSHNTFVANRATAWGGAVELRECGGLDLEGIVARDNLAEEGGAVRISLCERIRIFGASLRENRATELGGGVRVGTVAMAFGRVTAGSITIERSFLSKNVAGTGGAISLEAQGGKHVVRNCVLHGNAAWSGASVHVQDGIAILIHLTINESLFPDPVGGWSTSAVYVSSADPCSVSNCWFVAFKGAIVHGNPTNQTVASHNAFWGSVGSHLVNVPDNGTHLFQAPVFLDGIYTLGPSDPGIDAALPGHPSMDNLDVHGDLRPIGAGPDIGAHEWR